MNQPRIVIAGAGGMGREALTWVRDALPHRIVAGFLDDAVLPGAMVAGLPVLGPIESLASGEADCVVAIGNCPSRRAVAERLDDVGVAVVTVVHPTAYVGPGVTVGRGSIVCPNVIITRDAAIGEAVIINFGAQMGHDCRIGDFVHVAPGAKLAGAVTIEEGADIGLGAAVVPGVTVGAGARIGAGSVVVRDVPAGVTAVGVPCRPLDG